MKKLLLTLFIVASLILPMQVNAGLTVFGGFLPCTSDDGTTCTTPRYISTPGITLSTTATFSFLTSGYLPKAGTGGALGNSAIYQDSSTNIGLGTATFGTSAAKVIGIPSGTAPTTSPADAAQVWTADHNAQAGYARLHERTEDGKSAPIALLSEVETYKNPLAFAQGMKTISSTSVYGLSVADSPHIDPGTNNYTIAVTVKVPDWTPSATNHFLYKATGGNGWGINVQPTGKIGLVHASTSTNYQSSIANTFTDDTTHVIMVTVSREAVGVVGTATFYLDGYAYGSAASITAGAPTDINTVANLAIMGDGVTNMSEGVLYSAAFWNRTLSATEALAYYKNGIDYADKWGSQTSIITGNDSTFAGASNWANVDIAAYDATGDLTITANAAAQYCTLPVANATTVANKKYRLKFDVANLVSTWTIKNFTGTQTIGTISANGTGQTIEFTASTTGGLRIVSVANNSSADIDNVYLYEIGATLALEPEGIQRDAWKDSSTNGLNAAYPASGSSLTRQFPLGMETLLSTTTVTFAADGDTNLFTVPTGRRCVLTKAIIIAADNANSTDITIGQDGAESDWLPTNQMDNLDAANDAIIVMPVPNTTPTKIKSYAGGTVIQINVANHAGAAGNTVMLFGVLY